MEEAASRGTRGLFRTARVPGVLGHHQARRYRARAQQPELFCSAKGTNLDRNAEEMASWRAGNDGLPRSTAARTRCGGWPTRKFLRMSGPSPERRDRSDRPPNSRRRGDRGRDGRVRLRPQIRRTASPRGDRLGTGGPRRPIGSSSSGGPPRSSARKTPSSGSRARTLEETSMRARTVSCTTTSRMIVERRRKDPRTTWSPNWSRARRRCAADPRRNSSPTASSWSRRATRRLVTPSPGACRHSASSRISGRSCGRIRNCSPTPSRRSSAGLPPSAISSGPPPRTASCADPDDPRRRQGGALLGIGEPGRRGLR